MMVKTIGITIRKMIHMETKTKIIIQQTHSITIQIRILKQMQPHKRFFQTSISLFEALVETLSITSMSIMEPC